MDERVARLFEICKLQASVDGAFDDALLEHWFQAALDLCAGFVDLTPRQQVRIPVQINAYGDFTLNPPPTGPVEVFDGYKLIMTLPPRSDGIYHVACLCCLCHPYVRYTFGTFDECGGFPPSFEQAVARIFTYIAENRGDTLDDENIVSRSGAKAFLPNMTYVL